MLNPSIRVATLKDVARAANVAASTVSRVLNKTNSIIHISEQTRQQVLKAAESLGYQSNFLARSLRLQKTQTVGVVVADIRDPFFSEVIAGIEQSAAHLGYFYLLSSVEHNPHRETLYVDIFRLKHVDGILIAGTTNLLDDPTIEELLDAKVPVVLVGREFYDRRVPCVTVDNVAGGRLAVQHLLGLGHVQIGHITGGSNKLNSQYRLEGYKLALANGGVGYDSSLVVEGGARTEDGYYAMQKLLQRNNPPTAVFCFNDCCAMGALKAIRETGLSVPGDVSLVGFDNLDFCEYMVPPLTTIHQPRFEMGYQAMQLFVSMAQNKQTENIKVLQLELIVRSSTQSIKQK